MEFGSIDIVKYMLFIFNVIYGVNQCLKYYISMVPDIHNI